MRNNSLIPSRPGKNHPISPRTHTPGIQIVIRQDWELVVGGCIREGEAFPVVVAVRVVVGADGLAVAVVGVAFVEGGVDVSLGVAGCAAGFGALARLRGWGGVSDGEGLRGVGLGEVQEKGMGGLTWRMGFARVGTMRAREKRDYRL